jgi:hypothetical protein
MVASGQPTNRLKVHLLTGISRSRYCRYLGLHNTLRHGIFPLHPGLLGMGTDRLSFAMPALSSAMRTRGIEAPPASRQSVRTIVEGSVVPAWVHGCSGLVDLVYA